MRQAFVEWLWPWHTPYLHAPIGADMYWHTLAIIKSAWGIVLLPWLTPAAAYNLIILGTFIATGYASWLLCRSLTTQVTSSRLVADLAGFAGACVFAFSPYQLSQALGHLNLISLEGIPIFILAYIQYLRTNENRYALLLVGSMLYVSLCDYYYLVYLLTFLLFDFCRMAIVHGGSPFRLAVLQDRQIQGNLRAVIYSLAGALPVLLLLLAHAFPAPLTMYHGNSDHFLDLLAPFFPYRLSMYYGSLPAVVRSAMEAGMPFYPEESGYYLGLGVMVVALVAVVKNFPWARRLAAIGGVFLLLSFGNFLSVGGQTSLRIWVACLAVAAFMLAALPQRRWKFDLVIVLLAIAAIDFIYPFSIETIGS
jgi:hypothetical protein